MVVQHGAADAAKPPGAVHGGLELPQLVALHGRRREMLAPVFRPLDRPAEKLRGERDHGLFRLEDELGPEAAADMRPPSP